MEKLIVPEEIPSKVDPDDLEAYAREVIEAARDVRQRKGETAMICVFFQKHAHAQKVANILFHHYQGVYSDRIEVGLYH